MVEGERCPCSDSEKDWEMVGLPMRWGPRKKGKFRYTQATVGPRGSKEPWRCSEGGVQEPMGSQGLRFGRSRS